MLNEHGVVLETHGNRVKVATTRSSACHGCSSKSHACACGAMIGDGRAVANALNDAGAEIGDVVELSLPESVLLWASLIAYLLPIVLLTAGAITGHSFHENMGISSDAGGGLGAFAGFLTGMGFAWAASRRARRDGDKMPRVTRILKKRTTSPEEKQTIQNSGDKTNIENR